MRVEKHIWKIVCLLSLVVIICLVFRIRLLSQQVEAMEKERQEYATKESKAYIVERISNQMEEIAYQQKDISDQRREEAVHQMSIAEQMRIRAEEGENMAKQEQHKAQQYALHLEEAKNVAEGERVKAVEQRRLAETARNEADTLSRISLARSLASTSLIQYQSGNYDVSGLLAYSAWKLTKEYKGNVYHPIVYDALSKNSESLLSKKVHKGGVTRIVQVGHGSEDYVSVSKYGEIGRWHRVGNRLEERVLFRDSTYSFRDVYLDEAGTIYALNFGGTLAIAKAGQPFRQVLLPEQKGWKHICAQDGHTLLLVASRYIYLFDVAQERVVNQIAVPDEISVMGKKGDGWLIFGSHKGCWTLQTDGTLVALDIPIKEKVSSYAWSEQRRQAAVGTAEGAIYIWDEKGAIVDKLVGHRSEVTQLEFNNGNLFSSSYDGNLHVWNLDAAKIEALSLLKVSSWIYCFLLSEDNAIWIGDDSGMVYRILISPDDMAILVKRNLKRDFTDNEWIYFFGKDTPRVRLNILDKQ